MLSRREFLRGMGVCSFGLLGGNFLCRDSSAQEQRVHYKSAYFYRKLKDKQVECLLCPRDCHLSTGDTGICRVRRNMEGTLYSLVYGKPVAIHADPIEKKPFYHFLPGITAFSLATAGCNLRCTFCQNWEISQVEPHSISAYKVSPTEVVDRVLKEKIRVIACTYTEPTVFYEYMFDIAVEGNKQGIKTVMVSAGYINPEPMEYLCRILSAIKIDFKGFSEDFYRDLTGGSLKPVLKTLQVVKEKGVWLEIVNLVIPTKNDDMNQIKKMAQWIKSNLGDEVPLHFTRFTPMYKLKNLPATPVSTLEKAWETARGVGLKYVYVGNVPGHSGNHTYCPSCKKIIIRRSGFNVEDENLSGGKCKFCKTPIAGVFGS